MTAQNLTLFSHKDWAEQWNRLVSAGEYEAYGLILTNTSDCPEEMKEHFRTVLSKYIASRAQEQVCYCLLDMAEQAVKNDFFGRNTNKVEFIVNVLKEIYAVAEAGYLLIIGDRRCIASVKWKNGIYSQEEGGDWDKYVDSDLPYITLDTDSPFEGGSLSFHIAAGRIPSAAHNGFPEACIYLENVMDHNAGKTLVDSFVLSAQEWEKVSQNNFGGVHPAIYACPPTSLVEEMRQYGLNILPGNASHNLLCFNLHGSTTSHYWYSGSGHIAYSPECLPLNGNVKYVLATEACYGAKPVLEEGQQQSVLISAIKNRCLGFVGSTQIAYGISDVGYQLGARPSCADVLVGRFANNAAAGYTLGESYMKGLSAITVAYDGQGKKEIKGEEIKTVASFALYGDPSVHFVQGNCMKSSRMSVSGKFFHIPMPDVRRAVSMRLTKVSSQLSEMIGRYVTENYGDLADSKIVYYKVDGYNGYKAICQRTNQFIKGVLSIYFTPNGTVEQVYVSKYHQGEGRSCEKESSSLD